MTTPIIKTCKTADECKMQVEWFKFAPSAVIPANVQRISDTQYSMEFIHGMTALGPAIVWAYANCNLWHPRSSHSTLPIDRKEYEDYLSDKMTLAGYDVGNFPEVFSAIQNAELTPVVICHGDMTLENCINTPPGIKFIDPGFARGLPCQELDEAKLLQSTRGWHYLKHGRVPYPECFEVRPIHLALLISHLVRLLFHDHNDACISWARTAIDESYRQLQLLATGVRNEQEGESLAENYTDS